MKKILFAITMAVGLSCLHAQVLIDDTNTDAQPNAGAILELNSTNKGLLLPRIEGVNPELEVPGMFYYDAWGDCVRMYTNRGWQDLSDCLEMTEYSVSIANAANANEGEDQSFTVTVLPAVAAGHTVVVNYQTGDGTATAGADYTAANGTLTFVEGETTKIITVTTLEDELDEVTENYTVNITASTTGYANATITNGTATGNILNVQDLVTSTVINLSNMFDEYVANNAQYTSSGVGQNGSNRSSIRISGANSFMRFSPTPYPVNFTNAAQSGNVIVNVVAAPPSGATEVIIKVGNNQETTLITSSQTITKTFTNVTNSDVIEIRTNSSGTGINLFSVKIEKQQ